MQITESLPTTPILIVLVLMFISYPIIKGIVDTYLKRKSDEEFKNMLDEAHDHHSGLLNASKRKLAADKGFFTNRDDQTDAAMASYRASEGVSVSDLSTLRRLSGGYGSAHSNHTPSNKSEAQLQRDAVDVCCCKPKPEEDE